MTTDYVGRFSKVAAGAMVLPAQCAICGTSDCPEGFVDTKLDVDYFGVIYFCHKCAFELSRVFPDDPYYTLRISVDILTDTVKARDEHIERLEKILDGFASDWIGSRPINGDRSSSISDADESVKPAVEASPGAVGDKGELDSGATKPAKSADASGSPSAKRLDITSHI